jgi:hypothetical protein
VTRYGSPDVGFILQGGRSLLADLTEHNIDREAILEDTTVLGIEDETHAGVGIKKAEISQSGLFDDGTDRIHDALVGLSEEIACVGEAGNALPASGVARPCVGIKGQIQVNYARIASRGELHKAEASYKANGIVEECVLLHPHIAETTDPGDTESNSHDNAASSADGGAAYLQVSALILGGYTNLQVTIRDSADDITFADHGSGAFAAVTTAPSAQRIALTGTIRRYTAIDWDWVGAGSGQTATFMVGLNRA